MWGCIQGGLHLGGLHPQGEGWAKVPPGLPTGGGGGRSPPRDTWDTTGYGQQAGGRHLTGKHSFF